MEHFTSHDVSSRLSNSDLSAKMSWIQNYCLVCDTQTVGQTYCSQVCRLKESEQRSHSFISKSDLGPVPSSETCSTSAPMKAGRHAPQFYPPPANDFEAQRRRKQPTASQSVVKGVEPYRRSVSPTSSSSNTNTQLAGQNDQQRCLFPLELSGPKRSLPPETKISEADIIRLKEYRLCLRNGAVLPYLSSAACWRTRRRERFEVGWRRSTQVYQEQQGE
ncbi:hypothetical protein GE09DRAFT_172722 [Coniochaeta sp. 2T2.1]|nr:hypothetical protein GE09DRAFT_172722 [Coniochaeta sp. 2T2.1]